MASRKNRKKEKKNQIELLKIQKSQVIKKQPLTAEEMERRNQKLQTFKSKAVINFKCINLKSIDSNDLNAIEKAMGFSSFDTTKNKHVIGNNQGAIDVPYKRKYRQFLHKKRLYEIPLTKEGGES